MRRSIVLAAFIFATALVGGAGAARGVYVTTLDTLLPGGANSGGVTTGGLRYSAFAFRNDGPFNLNPAEVTVRITATEVIPEGPPNTINFRYSVDALAAQSGSTAIDYRVDLLNPRPLMNRVGLRFNGSVPAQGIGGGSASNLLTVSTVDGSDVEVGNPIRDTEVLDIFNDGPGRLDDSNSDFLSVNPTLSLRLSNVITLSAREAGRLEVSTVNNFLTIPEPSAGVFIALPSALALLARRRRHAAPAAPGKFVNRLAVGSVIVASFVMACVAGHARAATFQTSLDTLVPGGSNANGLVLPGGPRFSQFAFRNTGPHEVSPADVTVRISNDDFIFPERVNVQFTFGTPTAATQAGDVFIDYRVDMQDQSSINRVGARFVGSVPSQGAGSGSVFLTQTISTLNGEDLTVLSPVSDRESLVLSNDGPGRSDDVNSQFILLNPTYALRLSAQISLAAREDGRFDVAFSDQFSFIPEPAATTVVIPGIFLLMRRRRQVASVRPTPVA